MIDAQGQVFLETCVRCGVDFSRTLMLGRQELDDRRYAEPFFHRLGAQSVDSLDASGFEGATIIADLNRPLPGNLRRRFTAVYDGGTLEHVFDIATALRSCLDLVELGGHYISSSPANNWPGHGFYQFSPELIFRSLSRRAGFQLRGVFAVEQRKTQRWFAVRDPEAVGGRVYWRNRHRTLLIAVAQRAELIDLATFSPQQSDYAARWAAEGKPDPAIRGEPEGLIKRTVWRAMPSFAQRGYEAIKNRDRERFDPMVFRRIGLADIADHIGPASVQTTYAGVER